MRIVKLVRDTPEFVLDDLEVEDHSGKPLVLVRDTPEFMLDDVEVEDYSGKPDVLVHEGTIYIHHGQHMQSGADVYRVAKVVNTAPKRTGFQGQ